MLRGLVFGAVAFAAAFAAERLLVSTAKDIARYDAMRKMSGQEPLAKEIFGSLGSLVGGSMQRNGPTGLIAGLTNDLVRYAKLKGM